MVRLGTQRMVLLGSGEIKPEIAAEFFSANRSYFEPWSSRAPDAFYTVAFWEQRLTKNREMEEQGTQFVFFVFFKENLSEIVAQVSLSQIIRGPFQSCFMGYMTAEKHCRKGIMNEAIPEVVSFAFTQLHLHRIEANIIPRNEPSIRLIEKLGFSYEGLAPKYLQINGVWEDHKHYTIRNKMQE
jgi:ribosomal-protein-alanine N-acetyltransferase